LMIIAVTMTKLLVNLYITNYAALTRAQTTGDTQIALRTIDSDVTVAKTFLVTIDPTLSDPYGPDNNGTAWNTYTISANTQPVLILRKYATTANSHDPSKALVYINQNGCTAPGSDSNAPLMINVIYFVRGGNLYRRTLTDTSHSTCGTPFQLQSCPVDVAPRNAICKASDILVLSGVSGFQVGFKMLPGTTQLLLPTTQSALDAAVGAEETLQVTRTMDGQPSTFSDIIYSSKKNH
jgi:hypothetical protein